MHNSLIHMRYVNMNRRNGIWVYVKIQTRRRLGILRRTIEPDFSFSYDE